MSRPIRDTSIDLSVVIRETAWRQIAQNGAAALSLRAIARELGITAPAIYNYFPRRDDLVTALILDAFSAMGDAQSAALTGFQVGEHAARLKTLGIAYRDWAVAHPQRYRLIFGTPIPGYHAPREVTMPVAARSLSPLIGVLEAARQDGKLKAPQTNELGASLLAQLDAWRMAVQGSDARVLYLALVIWSRVHGMVSLELDHQYPPYIESPELIYTAQVVELVDQFIVTN